MGMLAATCTPVASPAPGHSATLAVPATIAPTTVSPTDAPSPTPEPQTQTDTSPEFLKVPENIYPEGHPDFDVATTPPTIDFAIVKMSPMYGDPYGVWGEAILGPDGAYYFAVGNHKGYGGADAFLIRYDPQTKTYQNILSTRQTCGWTDELFGDGKLHGIPDIAPNGDMWLLTFYGPNPKKSDWGANYFGGWLIKYNIYSGIAECKGHPIGDDSWPIHTWDWERNRLYAIGEYGLYQDPNSGDDPAPYPSPRYDWGKVLVYDTQKGVVLQGQTPPPDDIHWNRRSLLLDRSTGNLYGTESNAPYQFVKYDLATDTFSRMESRLETSPLYSWPTTKNKDGSFFIFDQQGNFYKFSPEQDRIESLGKNWLDGTWIENMRVSPGGRYLYYVSASGLNEKPRPNEYGLPLIQYDSITNHKKVIAFLSPFYMEKYQFGMLCSYTLALSADGSSAFIVVNGDYGGAQYGQVALLNIHIPETERSDDRTP